MVIKAQAGDHGAFGAVWSAAMPALRGYTNALTSFKSSAMVDPDDLLQQVATESWTRMRLFKAGDNPYESALAWFRTQIRHRLIDTIRELKPVVSLDAPVASGVPGFAQQIADISPSAGTEKVREETLNALKSALAQLSAEQLEIIELEAELKLTRAEIASLLGCTEDVLTHRKRSAIKKLQQLMGSQSQHAVKGLTSHPRHRY